jgi:nucleotide-binding universal stress UspA family protein
MLVVKQAAQRSYRTVLVPVDFSASSLPAMRHARAVAPDARIVVLHAYEVPFEGKMRFAGVEEKAVARYRLAAAQHAERQLNDLFAQAGWQEHEAKQLLLHGNPLLHILEQEQEYACNLIVMGKQGENPIETVLLGSMTRHVLWQSQCDVLVSV